MPQAPPPPPPPPLPAPRRGPPAPERGAQNSVDKVLPEYLADSFAVGVETEFLLFPRSRNLHGSGLRDVAVKAASEYNLYLSSTGDGEHPKMHNGIDQAYHGLQFAEWTLDSDSTIEMPTKDSAPWGFENISPIFRVHRDSRWREHVTKMWSFLSENYQITANKSCGTHVHVSRAKGYSIEDLKRICASIIHFEPAFEALLPVDRLSNEYARSNWLDNPNFGYKNRTRKESIDIIQSASTIRELVLLMNPEHDKMFGWNFLYLLHSSQGTVEFRRGAASTSEEDVFMWIEVALSFIAASINLAAVENLSKFPATVFGLRSFIELAGLPDGTIGMFDRNHLQSFFSTASNDAFKEPKPLGKLSDAKFRKLMAKRDEDKRKTVILKKVLQAPSWE